MDSAENTGLVGAIFWVGYVKSAFLAFVAVNFPSAALAFALLHGTSAAWTN
jgi:hypothetical protein